MKTLNYTTTGSLFNHTGILTHVGDYAGKFQTEAFEIINNIEAIEFTEGSWADIMHDNKGKCYAVFAEGELTMFSANCIYVELQKEDVEYAYQEAQSHVS